MATEEEQLHALCLWDCVDQVLANPSAYYRWHALIPLYLAEKSEEVCAQVKTRLLKDIPDADIEQFFLMTFLAEVTHDQRYSEEAAQILLAIRPLDIERITAFLVYEWGRHVGDGVNRQEFIEALKAAQFPTLIRLLQQQIALRSQVKLAARQITSVKKIALVTPYIANVKHTPTSLSLQHAAILGKLGIEVHVFSTQEIRIADMPKYLGSQGTLHLPEPDLAWLQSCLSENLSITLASEQFSLPLRYAHLEKKLVEFDPDAVFFVGLWSPFMHTIRRMRPTLGLCIHSVQPLAEVDLWLCASAEMSAQQSAMWAPELPSAYAFYHPYRVALQPVKQSLSRKELGLPSDAVVLISAGYRLAREIHGEWACGMLAFLLAHPECIWVLLGGIEVLPSELTSIPSSQLKIMPATDDVRSVFRCCDIYVNPPRLGGGFSVAEAMAESLPILAFSQSDGGNKIDDEAVFSTYDYFEKLSELVEHKGQRESLGRKMKRLFFNTLDLASSHASLMQALTTTVDLFNQREFAKETKQ